MLKGSASCPEILSLIVLLMGLSLSAIKSYAVGLLFCTNNFNVARCAFNTFPNYDKNTNNVVCFSACSVVNIKLF